MHLLEHTIATAELCRAADVSPVVLQNWIKRDLIGRQEFMPVGVEGGGKQGQTRRFSYIASIHIATANALVSAGLADVKQSFLVAGRFALTGAGSQRAGVQRHPGYPFHPSLGRTLIIATRERSEVLLDDIQGDLWARMTRAVGASCLVAVDVFPTFQRICEAFGTNAPAELDRAYPSQAPDAQTLEAS